MSDRPRLHFLDNLRAFAIVMVIVLHASITSMAFAPEWWYVVDDRQSHLFTAIVLLLDVPLMPALFFVAGCFAIPALQRRGPGGFVREKTIRIRHPVGRRRGARAPTPTGAPAEATPTWA